MKVLLLVNRNVNNRTLVCYTRPDPRDFERDAVRTT